MYIELRPRSRLKDLTCKIKSKSEDLLLWFVEHVPERLVPSILIEWLNSYLDKRLLELKQEDIKLKWKNLALQEAVNGFDRQNTEK